MWCLIVVVSVWWRGVFVVVVAMGVVLGGIGKWLVVG